MVTCATLLFGGCLSAARDFPPGQSLLFEIRDYVDHPLFAWPRTLVSYAVNFDQGRIKPYALILTRRDTGEKIPFQLSEVRSEYGYLLYAVVNFFAELPRGGSRVYELGATSGGGEFDPEVREARDGNSIVLDTGAGQVRIPDAVHVRPGLRVMDVTTTRIEAGPLFIDYRVRYWLEGGARYTATIRAVAGQGGVLAGESRDGVGRDDVWVELPARQIGPVDLNVYKDWVLEYPEGRRRPPAARYDGPIADADQLEAAMMASDPAHPAYDWLAAYSHLYGRMNERQKRRLTAWLLILAYRDREWARRVAPLFPDHPMAKAWAER